MSDNPEPECSVTEEYQRLVRSGKKVDAKRLLVRKLREGYHSWSFDQVLADIVDPDIKKARGRPPGSHLDPVWHAIGRDFDDLKDTGVRAGKAHGAVAEEYGTESRTVQKIVASYRDDMRDARSELAEWHAEWEAMSPAQHLEYEREWQAGLYAGYANMPDTNSFDADAAAWLSAKRDAIHKCPHGCQKGCRKAFLLHERHLCPFSSSPRNKIGI